MFRGINLHHTAQETLHFPQLLAFFAVENQLQHHLSTANTKSQNPPQHETVFSFVAAQASRAPGRPELCEEGTGQVPLRSFGGEKGDFEGFNAKMVQ